VQLRQPRDIPLNCTRVVKRKRHCESRAQSDASCGDTSRLDNDHVASNARDLILDTFACPTSNRDHGDDRSDTDDHAEHRQSRPQLVDLQRIDCDARAGHKVTHADTSTFSIG
jgi:hypothetical protein